MWRPDQQATPKLHWNRNVDSAPEPFKPTPSADRKEVEVLIDHWLGWRLRERDPAIQMLRELGPAAMEPLLDRAQKYRSQLTRPSPINIAFLLLCALKSISRLVVELDTLHSWCVLAFLPLTVIVSFPAWKYRKVADFIAESADLRSVGILAEAAYSGISSRDARARAALRKLLPQVKASDAGLLTEYQRSSLYRSLHNACVQRDNAYVTAALRAIGQIGDQGAIPYVRKVLQWAQRSNRNAAVREHAMNCLELLEQRLSAGAVPHLLLRPADSAQRGELLRPAGASPEAESETLLRPAQQ